MYQSRNLKAQRDMVRMGNTEWGMRREIANLKLAQDGRAAAKFRRQRRRDEDRLRPGQFPEGNSPVQPAAPFSFSKLQQPKQITPPATVSSPADSPAGARLSVGTHPPRVDVGSENGLYPHPARSDSASPSFAQSESSQSPASCRTK